MENKDLNHKNLAKHTHDLLLEMAHKDSLTGLLNRRGYTEKLEEFYSRAKRTGDRLQIILLDVDGFKKINKKYNHVGGDEALKSVAETLNYSFRDVDVKARWGGDEFVILTLDKSDSKAIPDELLNQRLNFQVDKMRPGFMDSSELKITTGIIVWNGKETKEELFERVDKLMMSKKENG